jgi:hypothetical protein
LKYSSQDWQKSSSLLLIITTWDAPMKKLEPLYTVAETAKILNACPKTVRRRIDDGLLWAIKLGRGDFRRGPVRVALADLEDFIRDHRGH